MMRRQDDGPQERPRFVARAVVERRGEEVEDLHIRDTSGDEWRRPITYT